MGAGPGPCRWGNTLVDYKIEEIEGIGPAFGAKLAAAGITKTSHLLKMCDCPGGRKQISKTTGISTHQLLKWADMADLMRISGIGKQFGELLKAAGVDTIKELRMRRPDHLAEKLAEVNQKKRLARTTPGEGQLQRWIAAAKQMKPVITY